MAPLIPLPENSCEFAVRRLTDLTEPEPTSQPSEHRPHDGVGNRKPSIRYRATCDSGGDTANGDHRYGQKDLYEGEEVYSCPPPASGKLGEVVV
jgi:hypothetical protein